MYFHNVVGTRSYTTSTTNMYHKDFTYLIKSNIEKKRAFDRSGNVSQTYKKKMKKNCEDQFNTPRYTSMSLYNSINTPSKQESREKSREKSRKKSRNEMSVVHRQVLVQCSLTPSTTYTFAPIEGGVGQPHQTHPALWRIVCCHSFCSFFYSFYHPVALRLPCRRQQPVQRRLLFLPTIFRHFQFPLQQQPLAFEPAQFFLARQQLPWDIHFTLGFVFKHPHTVLGQCMNVVPGTAGLVEYFLQQSFAKHGRFHGIGDNQRGGRGSGGGRRGGRGERGGWRRRGIGVGMKGVACSVAVACRTYGVKGGHASIKQCPRGDAMGGRAGERESFVWFVWFVWFVLLLWWEGMLGTLLSASMAI